MSSDFSQLFLETVLVETSMWVWYCDEWKFIEFLIINDFPRMLDMKWDFSLTWCYIFFKFLLDRVAYPYLKTSYLAFLKLILYEMFYTIDVVLCSVLMFTIGWLFYGVLLYRWWKCNITIFFIFVISERDFDSFIDIIWSSAVPPFSLQGDEVV